MKFFKIYQFVLLSIFINYSNSYLRSSFFTRSRSIEGKECISKNLKGQCMFSFECMNHKGNSIGICIEKYYIGSCCYFNSSSDEDELVIPNDDKKITSESNLSITNEFNQQNTLINNTSSIDLIKKNISNLIQLQYNESNSQSLSTKTDLVQDQQNSNKKITLNLIDNFNDNATTISTNTTALNKLYNSEQIKPINLIDQTTINSLDVNYLLTNLNNFLANLTDNANKNRINLNKTQSNSLNNSSEFNNNLIEKNLTNNQSIAIDSQLITTTTTEQPIELPIKNYFANLECGLQSKKLPQARIVNGRNAAKGEFPSKCGGVLIHPSFVLTAAHCSPKIFLNSLFVILGESNEPKPVVRAVKRMIIHKDYNLNTFENDIALLELDRPIENQIGITPICLPINENDESFEMATVTGFGKLKFGGSIPTTLQVAKLPILDNKKCQEMYLEMGIVKKILPTFLCAGSTNGQDSCEGDSGSPLFSKRKNGQWVLLGTVSHGVKCNYLPGIHMRTKLYLDWIYNTIQYSIDNSPKKGTQRLRYQ